VTIDTKRLAGLAGVLASDTSATEQPDVQQ